MSSKEIPKSPEVAAKKPAKAPKWPYFQYLQPKTIEERIEDVELYAPHGYYAVDIGDVIRGGDTEYEVVHKLGSGGLSTVWLVRSSGERPSYFALKILVASVTDPFEVTILEHLAKVAGAGHPSVVRLHEWFKVSGNNGDHYCLVFPVLGPNLLDFDTVCALSSRARHHVGQQIANAVTFLHDHGVCHGGKPAPFRTPVSACVNWMIHVSPSHTDLTPSNVLLELPDIQSMSLDRLYEFLGPIKSEKLTRPNGRRSPFGPNSVVQAPDLSGLDYSSSPRVQIVDFGQAFFTDRPPLRLGTPINFFPPEICFGYSPSTKSDVWGLACVLYQVHANGYMFPCFFRVFEILVSTVARFMGPLPQSWKGRFDFDEYGQIDPPESGREPNKTDPAHWFDKTPDKSIDGRLSKDALHLSTRQREAFVRLLNEMVAYDPEKRLSAVDVTRRLRSEAILNEGSADSVRQNLYPLGPGDKIGEDWDIAWLGSHQIWENWIFFCVGVVHDSSLRHMQRTAQYHSSIGAQWPRQ